MSSNPYLKTCPHCGKEIRAEVVICPYCHNKGVTGEASKSPFPAVASEPAGRGAAATKKCPYCAEEILAEAIKCKHCGSDLRFAVPASPGAEPAKKRSSSPVLLILIGFACIILAVIAYSMRGSGSSSPRGNPGGAPNVRSAPDRYTVRYEVGGSAERANLTYTNASGNTEQHTVALPWDLSFSAEGGDFIYISAQNDGEFGTIDCKIRVNGVIVESADSSSAYGIASCSGSVGD